MVPNSGQIFDSATTNEDYGVFLEVMPNTWNVCRNFISIC